MSDIKTSKSAAQGESWTELAKTVIYAGLIAVVIRTFLFQPFNIPSASMEATLLVGDYLFVEKFSYGYSRYTFPFGGWPFGDAMHGRAFFRAPQRGDVVVFKFPQDNSTDFIKRLIGIPGDRIKMTDDVLYLNGKPVPRVRVADYVETVDGQVNHVPQYRETLPGGKSYLVLDRDPQGPMDTTDTFVVPPGHYFMMGDNRDNSDDSRAAVGYVPAENLEGKAEFRFFSIDGSAHFWEFWEMAARDPLFADTDPDRLTLDALEQNLGHRFSDPELLRRALTHASADAVVSNERLEFLGDRVLGLIVAEALHARYPDDAEGALALKFNALARGAACAQAAEAAGLAAHIILAGSERASGGRHKPAILSGACEAVIAALYLDGGMDAARRFVERYWAAMFDNLGADMRDAKTRLQEWAQAPDRQKDGRGPAAPVYALVGREGPDHAPRFVVEVTVNGEPAERGEGGSKREAEQDAAARLLAKVET